MDVLMTRSDELIIERIFDTLHVDFVNEMWKLFCLIEVVDS